MNRTPTINKENKENIDFPTPDLMYTPILRNSNNLIV